MSAGGIQIEIELASCKQIIVCCSCIVVCWSL
uniref:Uncharacterized protein n=1 Tax=Arundo donax TaxID=35708 RepID=A0A0A9BFE3_ARUDO